MARNLTAALEAEFAKAQLRPVLFVELEVSSTTVRVWSGTGTVTWNSQQWIGVGRFGGVSTITETTEVRADGVALKLSGVDPTLLGYALTEIRHGKPCKLWLGAADESSGALSIIADPFQSYSGKVDTCDIEEGGEVVNGNQTATIQITVENRLIEMNRNGGQASDVLRQMAAAMAGAVVYVGGKYEIYAGAYIAPTATLTETDLRGTLRVKTQLSKQELFNGVKGTFFSAANNWQLADFPTVDGTSYVTEDGGERVWQDIQLPFTTSAATAQRVGKINLETARRQLSAVFPGKLNLYKIKPWEIVKVTNSRFGWTDKTFRVMNVQLVLDDEGALACDLMLRAFDATVYSWTAATDEKDAAAPGTTTLPDILTVGQPTGFTLSSGSGAATLGNDGLALPRLKFSWTAPADQSVKAGGHIIVQYKKNADSVWITAGTARGDAVEFFVAGVTVGTAYDGRLIAVNSAGVAAAPVDSTNHTVTGPTSISPTASYLPLTNPLTATDAGATATVSIAAFTMRFPGSDLSINSGSVTGLSFESLYYIFYDDPDFNGGSVTYGATTTKETALNGAARFYVGSIFTPKDGWPDTTGNNDGGYSGTGGNIVRIRFRDALELKAGNGSTANLLNAIDADPTSFASGTLTGDGGSNEGSIKLERLPDVIFQNAKSVKLKIRSSVPTNTLNAANSPRPINLYYSLNYSSTLNTIYHLNAGQTRAETVDEVSIPINQNLDAVEVEFDLESSTESTSGTATIRMFDAYIEIVT